jgi:creatinine amidohydrolase
MALRQLEKMTSPDVRDAIDAGHDTVVVPFGSVEQHGAHLPIGTDAMLGDEFGRRIAEELDAILAPTMRVGCADHHLPFAGTMSVSEDTLISVAVDFCRSLAHHGFRRIILLPTHGGNFRPIRLAAQQCANLEGTTVIPAVSDFTQDVLAEGTVGVSAKFGISPSESGAHAGEWETSIMLHLAPELVHMDNAVEGYVGDMTSAVKTVLDEGNLKQIAPNGIMGDPRRADAERGEPYLASLALVGLRNIQKATTPA